MKCSICGKKIETTFLNKIVGTMLKDKGKKYYICKECQKKFPTKQQVLKNIK